MGDEADFVRNKLWDHLTAKAVSEIAVGEIGAVVTTDRKRDGHCPCPMFVKKGRSWW